MAHPANYLGKPASSWIEQLRSDNALIRRLACYALGEIGPSSSSAPLLQGVAHADPVSFVRVWAAAALAAVEPSNPEALAALRAGLHDEQGFVRSLAAWHLGRLGACLPHMRAVVPAIQQLHDDPDRSVRAEAVQALKRLHCKAGTPRELDSMTCEPPKAVGNQALNPTA